MNKLVSINQPKPPAERKPWPKQADVKEQARDLDRVLSYHTRFEKALDANVRYQRLTDLQKLLDDFEGSRAKRIAERFAEHHDEVGPAEWYDEYGEEVQQNAVSILLAQLVGSFPTSNLPDAKTFTRVLLEDVMALSPCYQALESACRTLRQTKKFMPAISEVIAAIEKEQEAWDYRWDAANFVLNNCERLNKRIADRQQLDEAEIAAAEERRERQRKYREAKAAPLVLGDRVRHEHYGAGVITKRTEGDWDAWYVLFDNDDQQEWMMADCLEKLVEGDECFVPPAKPIKAAVPFEAGDPVKHQKFGEGIVQRIDGNKVVVLFGNDANPRLVVTDFIERRPISDGSEPLEDGWMDVPGGNGCEW